MPPRRRPAAEIRFPELAEQFRAAADARNVSVRQLALTVGVSRTALRAALAGGNITLDTLRSIATALGIQSVNIAGLNVEVGEGRSDPGTITAAIEVLKRAEKEVDQGLKLLTALREDRNRRDRAANRVAKIAERAAALDGDDPAAKQG